MKKPFLYFFTLILILAFYQKDERNNINQAYQNMTGALRTDALKTLPTLEALLENAIKNLDPQDTLLANIYFSTGKIYLDLRIDTQKALEYNQKALAIRRQKLPPNNPKLAQSYHNTALILRLRGRYGDAKQAIQQALLVKAAAAKPDTASLLRSYHELAMNLRELGAYNDALTIGQQMVSLAQSIKDSLSMAKNIITVGSSFYLKKDYKNAFDIYKNALSLLTDIGQKKPSMDIEIEKAACLNNMGIMSRFLNKKADAQLYLNQSLKTYNTLLSTIKDSSLNTYIGNVTMELAHTELVPSTRGGSLPLYQKALGHFGNTHSTYIVECYNAIGDIYLKQNILNDALLSYHKAIEKGLNATSDIATNPTLTDNVFPDLLKAFANKAHILTLKNDLKLALETYQKCDTIIQKLQTYYEGDKAKYTLSAEAAPIFQRATEVALQLYEQNKTAPQYFEVAMGFSEKNKALILLENLRDNAAKNFAGVPDSLRQVEQNAKSEIAFWEKQVYEAPDSLKNKYQKELFGAKQNFNNFIQSLENQYPKYTALKYTTNRPLSIATLQKDMDDNIMTIAYSLFDTTLYTFCFNKTDFKYYKNTIDKITISQFQALRKSLANEKYIADSAALAEQGFLQNGYDFYKILLENPLKDLNKNKTISRLRIVPDGLLGYIPFELLLTEKTNTWKGVKVPYILRQYAVSYAYSLRLIDESGSVVGRNFGGFGIEYDDKTLNSLSQQPDTANPNMPKRERSENLSRLAFADDEVRNIATILGQNQIYLNADATKLTFMKKAGQHGILHLAMHGAIDEKNPLNSGLIFSKTDSADNILRGYDLYALQLRTGLAVLSACNTGNGALQRNEGIMSVARAFAYAGCPSTVMSLWSIPDESTSKVMIAFYKYLKAGDTKDIALQKAKLDYLDSCSPQYSIPNYWGATVVIGNVSALDFKAWYQQPWALFLGVIGLFVVIIVLAKFVRKA
jgi:CHAT domain-containing protein/tetratricopeptide (TPR) repeat protein